MADTDTPATPDTPAKKPARRRSTTPAKSAAAKPRTAKAKPAEAAAEPPVKAKAPPKPRSTKRTTAAAAPRKAATRKAAARPKSTAKTVTDKVGGKWGAAAIAGGLAAAAGAAALFTLRGSTAKPGDPAKAKTKAIAHQPDGKDASKSFDAGIADENTIPDKE